MRNFANKPYLGRSLALAFGQDFHRQGAQELAQAWQAGDLIGFPPIEVVSGSELNGAYGEYSQVQNRIYLSQEFLSQNQGNLAAIVALLLEEYGHSVDGVLNTTDAPGDEGRIFAKLVQMHRGGEALGYQELQQLKAEDDAGVISLNGTIIAVEMANFTGDGNNNNITGTDEDDVIDLTVGQETTLILPTLTPPKQTKYNSKVQPVTV